MNGERATHICKQRDTLMDRILLGVKLKQREQRNLVNNHTELLTQGGSMYNVTVGTVVNINIHCMMLLYLHTAGDEQETHS